MNNIVLEANHISKNFYDPVTVKVLDDICFSVSKGEFVSVMGKSGCGKSTLLYVLSTMDSDYSGELRIDNETMADKNERQLAEIRNEKIGFVFQFHYLLNEFNVLDNIMLPALKLDKYPEHIIRQHAMQKLEMLDIGKLAGKKPHQISGGEKQRVSIARAMINDPAIIMGDEPTGNLDKKNSEIVFNSFQRIAGELNQTLLIVTHDRSFAEKTHRIIEMEDGKIINQYLHATP